jgi:hypothetical protein
MRFSGGKRLSQFNHDNPIDPLSNAVATLLFKNNFLKAYENWFGGIQYHRRNESGLDMTFHVTYEDRIPVENTTDFSFFKKKDSISPNHPVELANIPFKRHQATVAGFVLLWQPGQKYIQFPGYKVPLGSKYPTLELEYNKGLNGVLGSDVDFDKWKFSVFDNMNFKLGGEFRYRISIGGFFNSKKVEIPDMQHFNGNRVYSNRKYLNSFQLASYYQYSNKENFYTLFHFEHHLNGLLSNKIPLFNKLKWYLLAGSNAFYVNRDNYYIEAFAGVENIFKFIRIDFINAYQPGVHYNFGIRVGAGGLIGGKVKFEDD